MTTSYEFASVVRDVATLAHHLVVPDDAEQQRHLDESVDLLAFELRDLKDRIEAAKVNGTPRPVPTKPKNPPKDPPPKPKDRADVGPIASSPDDVAVQPSAAAGAGRALPQGPGRAVHAEVEQ